MPETAPLPSPQLLLDAIGTQRWPAGRIPGSAFPALSFLKGVCLELIQAPDDIAPFSAYSGAILFMTDLARSNADDWRVYLSSRGEPAKPLPWLDLDLACVVAIGADHGDDLWIALDYRESLQDPPLVFNRLARQGKTCHWHTLVPALSGFIETAASVAPR